MAKNSIAPELLRQATDLVLRTSAISVSLLQRHFLLAYSDCLALIAALEDAGVVTPPGADGYRTLSQSARSTRLEETAPSSRDLFEAWAIDPYEGGDGGDPGTRDMPSIWMFGIEHGDAANLEQEPQCAREERDYSIDTQMRYRYNVAAFKLFAAMHGEPVEQFEEFARRHQPWVPGSKGYFKGNLYPYPCQKESTWTAEAKQATGFECKKEMINWCKTHRLPAIASAVRRHEPRLFIGVGVDHSQDFASAFFGAGWPLQVYQFVVNGYTKKIRYATLNDSRLVVLPHISNGANGLNSPEALQVAGSFIAGLIR